MRLRDAVTYFSTESFSDAFDEDTTFVGKVNPFAEVANSGVASQRRILETPREEVIPASHVVVSPSSEKFVVAASNYDFWDGSVVRHKYPMLPVEVMGAVGSIGETLSATQPDAEVYAYPYFVRREMHDEERSDYLSGFEIYMAPGKSFFRSNILKLDTDYYRFKTDSWRDGAGFTAIQAVKIESPIQTFGLLTDRSTYDPVTDTYGSFEVIGVECFVEDLMQDYEFVTPSFTKIEIGDKAISILKTSADVGVNTLIGEYIVLSVRDQGDWVTCQCRNNPNEAAVLILEVDTFIIDGIDGASIVEDSDPTTFIIDD